MESRFQIHGESLSTMESRFQLDTQFKINSIQNISELHKSYPHKLYKPIFLNPRTYLDPHIYITNAIDAMLIHKPHLLVTHPR